MVNVTELLRQGKKKEIWDRFCGFLDLSIDEFMKIQKDLLMEQIERLAQCELGRKLLGRKIPRSVEEFRKNVPFTTYADYSDYLLKKREDVLPEKPYIWAHTSGRSGEYEYKWVPYTRRMYEVMGEGILGLFILCSCNKKGDIALEQGDRFIYSVASPPYISGVYIQAASDLFNFQALPRFEEVEKMNFQERIQKGIQLALLDGFDFFIGLTSILMKITDQILQLTKSKKFIREILEILKNPRLLFRLLKATIKAKIAKRDLMPKDIWNIKGIICGGTDTSIYKEKIKKLWDKTPSELYGSAELGAGAIQSWNSEAMVFLPKNNFWEFVPELDYRQIAENAKFTPKCLMLNEVEAGKKYVLVGSNFYGGILTRYITGDLIQIVSLEDKRANINLPHMLFSTRLNDEIDIGAFTRLTERTIWQAIENSKLDYVEWTVRKEYIDEKPVLHLYIELKNKYTNMASVEEKIHECLKQLDNPYRDLEEMIGIKPLKVSPFSNGTFNRYYAERQAAGADLAHLKPPHINPSDKIINKLLRMSSWKP